MKRVVKPLVMVADDDQAVLHWMDANLCGRDCRLVCVSNKKELFQQLNQEVPSLLFLDLGEDDGIELMQQLLNRHRDLTVVLLTGFGTIESAVNAIRLGAFDYLSKPPDLNRLKVILRHTEEKRGLNERIRDLEQAVDETGQLWGESAIMPTLRELSASVAPTEATVLIQGESGTGKELAARSLHQQSSHRQGPFVPVNMAALPHELVESTLFGHERGAFTGADQPQIGCCEAAEGGTLFLDEIGEMDQGLQVELLRFLQDRIVQRVGSPNPRKMHVRVVAATNRDLRERIQTGQFREDLFYRLNVVPIVLPPLRQHLDDVPLLASRFLQRAALNYAKPGLTFSRDVLEALSRYRWPGNVRQLENLVERLAILGKDSEIGMHDLPPEILGSDNAEASQPPVAAPLTAPPALTNAPTGGTSTMEQLEKQAIFETLVRTRGNVREAAKVLGCGQATVYRKIKRFGIVLEDLGRAPNEASATQPGGAAGPPQD